MEGFIVVDVAGANDEGAKVVGGFVVVGAFVVVLEQGASVLVVVLVGAEVVVVLGLVVLVLDISAHFWH